MAFTLSDDLAQDFLEMRRLLLGKSSLPSGHDRGKAPSARQKLFEGRFTSALSEGGSATFQRQYDDAGTLTDTSYDELTVYSDDPYYTAANGDWGLVAFLPGTPPRWKAIPHYKRLIGKTDASITKGSSGTVSVYRGTTKGSETDSGIDITAYNRFADLGADKWCFCEFIGGGWELYVAECD